MRVRAGCRIYLNASSFLAGAVLIQQVSELPSLWWCSLLLLFIPLGLRWRWLRPCTWLLVGSAWAVFRADLLLANGLPAHLERKEVNLVAVVSSLVQHSERYVKFTVHVESLRYLGRTYSTPRKVSLRWYYPDAEVRLGQRWRFRARLKRPHGFQNPGGFDYEKWLFRRGIRATGYVLGANAAAEPTDTSWWSVLRERVQQHLVQSGLTHNGLLRALSVGDRAGIRPQQWRVLQRTGTIHLLAISGLHIGLVSGFCFFIGLLLARLLGAGLLWLPAPKIGAVMSVAGAAAYALLAGFTVPTQRASVMVVALMTAILFDRSLDIARSLAFALFIVLAIDPLSVLDLGFWLSFSALISILLALGLTAGMTHRVARALCVQSLLTLMLAPLVLLFFDQVSLGAPAANLVAIPVVAFTVVPLVLMGSMALALDWITAADFLYRLADQALTVLWPVLRTIAAPDWIVWIHSPQAWQAIMLLSATVCVCLPLPRVVRFAPYILCGIVFLMLVNGAKSRDAMAPGEFMATVLDVGQGLSVAVRTRNYTLLYDTGARYSSGLDAGRAVIVPYLRRQKVRRLNMLVISHGDNDHIGGLRSVLAEIETARVLTSVPQRIPQAQACVAGQQWTWDGVQFRVLSPGRADVPAHNNASCVIKITGEYGSLLLTGDIERPVEHGLVQKYGRSLRSDVLLVPHQGSQTSSSPLLIDAVAPRIAIVSAGYLNMYGHPAQSVTQRYADRDIALYNTAVDGAISVHVRAVGIKVERYRVRYKRYWSK